MGKKGVIKAISNGNEDVRMVCEGLRACMTPRLTHAWLMKRVMVLSMA